MAVTLESNNQFLAFRRILYSLSKQLTAEEAQGIVKIYLYHQKEQYERASALDILCKLESSGMITASNPDKLLDLMKDLKRQDLVNEVKDFLKKKKSKSGLRKNQTTPADDASSDSETEDDLILRATLEAALVQATVLLQHMEMLQNSISGCKISAANIKHVVIDAAQTSEALAERLRKAEARMNDNKEGCLLSDVCVESRGYIPKGYMNSTHTDRYTTLMSSPTLAHHYNGDTHASTTTIPEVTKATQRMSLEQVPEGVETDDDDYEPMNPGVLVNIQQWRGRRATRSAVFNDYGTSKSYSQSTTNIPEAYSSVLIPPLSSDDYFDPRSHMKGLISPTKRSRSEMAVPKYSEHATMNQRWAKPHSAATKRHSLPYGPKYYNPASGPEHTTTFVTIPSPKKILSKSVTAQSAPQHWQSTTDDNYTTLHPTAKQDIAEYTAIQRRS